MTMQIIEEGPRNVVVKFAGVGPDTLIASALNPPCEELRIVRITYDNAPATSTVLQWDATVPVDAWANHEHSDTHDFDYFGGLVNNAGAGVTGNVIYVGATGAHMVVLFKKIRLLTVYN